MSAAAPSPAGERAVTGWKASLSLPRPLGEGRGEEYSLTAHRQAAVKVQNRLGQVSSFIDPADWRPWHAVSSLPGREPPRTPLLRAVWGVIGRCLPLLPGVIELYDLDID
jgi:hypothetical protein